MDVSVFICKINEKIESSVFQKYLKELPIEEVERVLRFQRWQDQQLSMMGKLLLKRGLAFKGYKDTDLQQLKLSPYNKPFFNRGPCFNISHSGEYVICAIASAPVGIDIEVIRPLEMRDFENCWSANELKNIATSSDPLKLFYKYWTKKEAVIKADGRGLNLQLQGIDTSYHDVFIDGKQWFVTEIDLHPNYCCHMATDKMAILISTHFLQFQFPDEPQFEEDFGN